MREISDTLQKANYALESALTGKKLNPREPKPKVDDKKPPIKPHPHYHPQSTKTKH